MVCRFFSSFTVPVLFCEGVAAGGSPAPASNAPHPGQNRFFSGLGAPQRVQNPAMLSSGIIADRLYAEKMFGMVPIPGPGVTSPGIGGLKKTV
jgi:hypothetical protein